MEDIKAYLMNVLCIRITIKARHLTFVISCYLCLNEKHAYLFEVHEVPGHYTRILYLRSTISSLHFSFLNCATAAQWCFP